MISMMQDNSLQAAARMRASGFTLIELMITITIVAILLAIGVPSFKYVTSANRASSEVNGLLGDLQFARAEAIREGIIISACASSDGLTCSGSTSWQTGWIVFTDNSGVQGTKDGTDVILKIQDPFFGSDTLTADKGIKAVTFSRDGFAIGLGGAMTFTLHDATLNAQYTRCLSATIVGGLSTQIGGKTTAEGTTC